MKNRPRFVIVRRGQFAAFGLLAEAFVDEPNVQLLWDRRVADRRRRPARQVADDRRHSDRRRVESATPERHDYVLLGGTADWTRGVPAAIDAEHDGSSIQIAREDLARDIEAAARSDLNVLITGGDPISRRVLAHQIHRRSDRSDGPLVIVDHPLAEYLFGESGFDSPVNSDATIQRDQVPFADAMPPATWVIEEVGDLKWGQQRELLLFLDRLAKGHRKRRSPRDPRLITTSRHALWNRVVATTFREDLFYRLNTIHMMLPSGITQTAGSAVQPRL